MTHDYVKNGTTTLFSTLNVLGGTVIGRRMQKNRHQEFIRFINAVENFFSTLTRQSLKRGVLPSVVDLQAAIKR